MRMAKALVRIIDLGMVAMPRGTVFGVLRNERVEEIMKQIDIDGSVKNLDNLKPQNEIFIIFDSVGFKEFKMAKTPNIDKIGNVRSAHSSSFYTLPSVEAMFKGCVPQPDEGTYWPWGRYSNGGENVVIPRNMSERGYHTYLVSNNICVGKSRKVGKDHISSCDYFDNYITDFMDTISSRKLIKEFLNVVKEPYMMFGIFIETHTPYIGRKGDKTRKSQIDGIEYLDESIGELIRALEKRNNKYETRVIITSDHSECWVGKLNYGHNPRYLSKYVKLGKIDRLTTVPLVVGKI